ncbi:MAG: hypothetical protein ACP5QG_06455 [candidate division WOR-3 bacterium]
MIRHDTGITPELARLFTNGEEDTLCLIDPTYLRETEERLLAFLGGPVCLGKGASPSG